MGGDNNRLTCTHCGDICPDSSISIKEKVFCCNGCKTVYQLLNDEELKRLYDEIGLDGKTQSKFSNGEFEFLDDERIKSNLLDFTINDKSKVTLYLPQIICSACLYLLENISKLNNNILESKVDFLRKEVSITFNNTNTSLRAIVEQLTAIGYRPQLNIADTEDSKKRDDSRALYIKLGIAAFSFGNVMMLALPEYLSGGNIEIELKQFFEWLNIFFAFLIMYAASDYFKSSYTSLKMKMISIDIPIALGIVAMFVRSIWDIYAGHGPGYVDTLAGLIFFMLSGKLFQQKTYHNLSFDRNYKSYFPLSVIKIKDGIEKHLPVIDLSVGDRIKVRSSEIIPADSILISGNAEIDYSFVTGEARPIHVDYGDRIFAGGKQTGGAIIIETVKNFKQSYLTELWNRNTFEKKYINSFETITNKISAYFTLIIIAIAMLGFFVWLPYSLDKAFHALTAVLIIACPCALALTVPFTLGTTLRVYSKNKLYLKNTRVIEKLSEITSIVFDKTGTLTYHSEKDIRFIGSELSDFERQLIKSTVSNSTHPLSRIVAHSIEADTVHIDSYDEYVGLGIEAIVQGHTIRVGSKKWIDSLISTQKTTSQGNFLNESAVFISIDGQFIGYYAVSSKFREGLSKIFSDLKNRFKLLVISGDNDSDSENLLNLTGNQCDLKFNQLPEDKINEIKRLKESGEKVLMIGDGLNDLGALQQADIGIAITEDTANFTPGSDGILQADSLNKLNSFLKLSVYSKKTIKISFFISFLYNVIGLSYALTGELSPLIAAILMPISSVSIIALTVLRIKIYSYRQKL
ncbi:MAG TPA: heavy metal translocating P-type ATPase metal-binding domain-containing protein [Candidatus Kapabacteria bacterium]|nr:heavy metal translocating P-type ATPase metal-binding domain-containing protein [Candidatus Kapabacteria bacterium]